MAPNATQFLLNFGPCLKSSPQVYNVLWQVERQNNKTCIWTFSEDLVSVKETSISVVIPEH